MMLCRPGQGPPPDFSALLNDPAMMQSMQSMFASMTPQQMSDMSRQAGMPITEQQVTPRLARAAVAAGACCPRSLVFTRRHVTQCAGPPAVMCICEIAGPRQPSEASSAVQAEQISSQLKRLKPWQLQILAKGALFMQRVMNMTQQQKLMALAVIVLLFALLLRWLGWL